MVSASEEKTIQAIDDMLEQQIMDGLLNCHVERACLWWAINDMLEQQIIGGKSVQAIDDMLEQQLMDGKPMAHKKIYCLTSLMSC